MCSPHTQDKPSLMEMEKDFFQEQHQMENSHSLCAILAGRNETGGISKPDVATERPHHSMLSSAASVDEQVLS